jgi:hypothetical protein
MKPFFNNPIENVVAYIPSVKSIYLGSPSIVRLSDDEIIVSHDFFGPNSPKDKFGRENTIPYDEGSGLLFSGGPGYNPPNYHCAPVPVLNFNGRLWRAFEDNVNARANSWSPESFHSTIISVNVNADLLIASSWNMTNNLPYNHDSDPPEFDNEKAGWLEGNVVPTHCGEVWNILRVNSVPISNKAAITKVSGDGKKLGFNPKTGFIDFPGGMSKFTIRYDPQSRKYWTIANEVFNKRNPWQRNNLVLASSEDLIHWEHNLVLLHIHEDMNLIGSKCKIGFQYADWLFDNDDLIFLSRTAYNGAHNFHDANYLTFHRLTNFRDRKDK